jgi:hypothetical protein
MATEPKTGPVLPAAVTGKLPVWRRRTSSDITRASAIRRSENAAGDARFARKKTASERHPWHWKERVTW